MPNDDPQLRASDDDRDRTASQLREHHAAGRLTVDEFQERLDATYSAKTLGQLQEQLADLPTVDLYHLPEQSMRRGQQTAAARPPVPQENGRLSPVWRHHWASWASVSMVLFVIWLITAVSSGGAAGLWFLWISGPWGAILLARWMFGQHPDGHQGQGRVSGGQGQDVPGQPSQQLPGQQLPSQHFVQGQDVMDQAYEEHRQRLDDHFQRHQERMQEQMQRRQEQLQRRQERRQDRLRPPGGS
jgi:exonuclease VII large subunit